MGKPLTKLEIASAIAEKTGITKATAAEILEYIAELAYQEARNSFTLPGIGKLVLVNKKARTARNPRTGETINVPAGKAVKFRLAKSAKDAILGDK